MYRATDKNNHTNYTNYETADFSNLTVLGTGGPGAKTPNIGYAAIEVNATELGLTTRSLKTRPRLVSVCTLWTPPPSEI